MLIKTILGFLFVLILFNLGKALILLRNRQSSVQMAKALTWRISLSLAAFALLLLAFAFGWIQPHGFSIKHASPQQMQE